MPILPLNLLLRRDERFLSGALTARPSRSTVRAKLHNTLEKCDLEWVEMDIHVVANYMIILYISF